MPGGPFQPFLLNIGYLWVSLVLFTAGFGQAPLDCPSLTQSYPSERWGDSFGKLVGGKEGVRQSLYLSHYGRELYAWFLGHLGKS